MKYLLKLTYYKINIPLIFLILGIIFFKASLATAPAATLAAVSLADDLPPPSALNPRAVRPLPNREGLEIPICTKTETAI